MAGTVLGVKEMDAGFAVSICLAYGTLAAVGVRGLLECVSIEAEERGRSRHVLLSTIGIGRCRRREVEAGTVDRTVGLREALVHVQLIVRMVIGCQGIGRRRKDVGRSAKVDVRRWCDGRHLGWVNRLPLLIVDNTWEREKNKQASVSYPSNTVQ